ncbi:MAG: DEAD/DEAH box helicase [Proteobacteria bacterium]|nr:DEAD/DEAH box helicase [Pseudomonadota bacterium]
MTQFSDFALLAPLQRALAKEGYTQPTPIQAQTLPIALSGRDVLGIAQTGTGKTAAFALPILDRLGRSGITRKPRTCRALILSPTRELASQIADSFRAYGGGMHLSIDVVFGGIPINRQIKRLTTGADILVATPGRLIDLVEQRALSLSEVEILVLDEADQMMDLGFIVPLKRILPMLPKKRQSLFFSATMPKAIGDLANGFLKDPVKVAVTPVATTAERVTQGVMFVDQGAKPALLTRVLQDESIARVLVFTRTKHGADKVVKHLGRDGIEAAAIHGNKSQAQREKALAAFRAGHCRVLVATDIAARGIDVEGVTHVINFELPNVPDSYVHRIGRTARAGASGIAIAFCAGDERPFLRDIEKLTRMPVPVLAVPDGFDINAARIAARAEPREPREASRDPRQQNGRGGHHHPQGSRPRNPRADQRRPEGEQAERPRFAEAKPGNGGFKERIFRERNPDARGEKPAQGYAPREDGAPIRRRKRRRSSGGNRQSAA